MKVLQN